MPAGIIENIRRDRPSCPASCRPSDLNHMAAVLPNTTPGTALPGLARALLQAGRLTPPQADVLQKKASADKVGFIDT